MPCSPAATFQSISDTASVTSPSSVLIGVASLAWVTVTDQPVLGCTSTDAIGVSVGSRTFSPTVLAASLSSGTRKVITASLPPGWPPAPRR